MPAEIVDVWAQYGDVQNKIVTSAGAKFFVTVTNDGMKFYSGKNSGGTLLGVPIERTVDELFEWVGDDGYKKKFQDRKDVKVLRKSNPPPPAGPPTTF